MTREELIECMARETRKATSASGKAEPDWDALHVSLRNWWLRVGEKTIDSLTAAGMVIVPKEFVVEPCDCSPDRFGMCFDHGLKGGCIRVKARAMTEAANAE